jgi:hypothetical protein
MLKGNKKYIFILCLCLGSLIFIQVIAPKPIDWRLSYMEKDKIPYGTSALRTLLPKLFIGQKISDEKLPLYNSLNENSKSATNYIIINQSFEPDKLDTRKLLAFVEQGNNAFIAANYFSGEFADTLKIKTDNYFDLDELKKNPAAVSQLYSPYDTTAINFISPSLKNKKNYVFTKGIDNTYFNSFDTTKTTVLGNNIQDKINFIKIKWGKGNIFISTVPEVYTNYLFVNEQTCDYIYKSLSYLPVQEVIWDEHYKVGNVQRDSPLRVVFNSPALMTAYSVLLLSILLFIIIGVKRRQRIIPVVKPLPNTTLDFVEIVGTLYYQTGNHKNIADKKMTYFLEHIRTTFQVKTTMYDDVFINRITNLSGIERERIHALFYYFSDLSIKQSITQQELLKLNRLIETFHKNNKR